MERNKTGQIQGRISRRMLVLIPRYSKTLSTCITNITFLACMVVERSLTKTFTKKGTDGGTNRLKPVYPRFFKSEGIKRKEEDLYTS